MRSQACRSSQTELPGTQPRIGQALQRRANAPLQPTKSQQPIETGLFGDQHQQGDFFQMAKRKPKAKPIKPSAAPILPNPFMQLR